MCFHLQERADGLHERRSNPEGQPARFPGLEDLHEISRFSVIKVTTVTYVRKGALKGCVAIMATLRGWVF